MSDTEQIIPQNNTNIDILQNQNGYKIIQTKHETVDKSCCVCYNESYLLYDTQLQKDMSLVEIEKTMFKDGVLPDDLIVVSSCNVHFICIGCIRKIVNNYENHPINEDNSHFSCPYPFEDCVTPIGFKNIFDHNIIEKVFRTDTEWQNYVNYAQQYAFPGFAMYKCPMNYFKNVSPDSSPILRHAVVQTCNAEILISHEDLRLKPRGELIVDCTQNENCLKRFCFYCKKTISFYVAICYDCKLSYENENPNVYNYYFNKNTQVDTPTTQMETVYEILYSFNEQDYLFLNREITVDIAVDQIKKVISNIDHHMICPICKLSLYKTEKCNGMSHHGIERCYACSRIGFKIKGLGDHWNSYGYEGCFRFDYEPLIKREIPQYQCNDLYCTNHNKGDCSIPEHQEGISVLYDFRKRAYVYHMLKSLLADVRDQTYDILYHYYSNTNEIKFLPYKQTFVLLDVHKIRTRDYTEEIAFEKCGLLPPSSLSVKLDQNQTIDLDDYKELYNIINHRQSPELLISNRQLEQMDISAWRYLIQTDLMNGRDADDQIQEELEPLLGHTEQHEHLEILELNPSDTESEI